MTHAALEAQTAAGSSSGRQQQWRRAGGGGGGGMGAAARQWRRTVKVGYAADEVGEQPATRIAPRDLEWLDDHDVAAVGREDRCCEVTEQPDEVDGVEGEQGGTESGQHVMEADDERVEHQGGRDRERQPPIQRLRQPTARVEEREEAGERALAHVPQDHLVDAPLLVAALTDDFGHKVLQRGRRPHVLLFAQL